MIGHSFAVQQVHRAFDIVRRRGVLKRFEQHSIFFEPRARALMQRGDAVRVIRRGGKFLLQTLAQEFGKEMMITIPMAFVVQSKEKKIRAFEIRQRFISGPGGHFHHRVAQRTAQTLKD
ncbi:MAG: hypothetical protein DPW18_20540 [Chloroflexi bacterium]|nr:hypothetical protein [Chloroflexota bacterium]